MYSFIYWCLTRLTTLQIPNYFQLQEIEINRCQSTTALMGQNGWRTSKWVCSEHSLPKRSSFTLFSNIKMLPVSPDSFPVSNVFAAACVWLPPDQIAAGCNRSLSSSLDVMQSTSLAATFGVFSCHRRQTKAHFGASKRFPERTLRRCWPIYG